MTPTWNWDSIACEVVVGAGYDVGWIDQTHPNGVREHTSDRGHVGLEVEADTREEAIAKFTEVSAEFVEWARSADAHWGGRVA